MGSVQVVPWAKIVRQNAAPPKYLFISWLLLHERLPTCRYLQRMGISVDQICCFCGDSEETLKHMFFACGVIQQIWREVALWCGVDRVAGSWEEEKQFLFSQCTTNSVKQRLYQSLVSVVVYHVWMERNGQRMAGKRNTPATLVKQCKLVLAWCCNRDRRLRSVRLD